MRALSIRVVCAALRCQITFVIDDEVVLVEMIVFTEIWTRVELNPGRIGTKTVAHDQMTDAAKEICTWFFCTRAVSGISWNDVRIVPEKLRYRDAPLRLCRPATLAQEPCGVRILEAIDRVDKADDVFTLQVRELVIVVTSCGTV